MEYFIIIKCGIGRGHQRDSSNNSRRRVHRALAAAVAVGLAALFIEKHQDPDAAPSDGPNMLPLSMM